MFLGYLEYFYGVLGENINKPNWSNISVGSNGFSKGHPEGAAKGIT